MIAFWIDRSSPNLAEDLRAADAVPTAGPVSVSAPGWGLEMDAAEDASWAAQDGVLAIVQGQLRYSDGDDTGRASAASWLARYQRHGENALDLVRGRFRIAVIDLNRRSVLLATDRFAMCGWCFAETGGRLRVADRADRIGGEIDAQSLFSYCFFHVIPAPRTIFQGVERLPAGHRISWNGHGIERAPYWTPRFQEARGADLAALKTRFVDLVRSSVAREADGAAVGAFLSGGTDSSTVSGMLGKVIGRPAKTYSIGFDAAGYDEMEYARIAARHFSAEHHEYYVTPDDLLAGIPQVAAHYDQPFGNSSALPAYFCARMAKDDGIARLLAGDGGDELFGGNTRYAKQRVFGWYDLVPAPLKSSLLEPGLATSLAQRLPLLKKASSYVEQARVPMPDRLQTYNLLHYLGLASIFPDAFLARIDHDEPLLAQRAVWNALPATGLVNRMLAFDWKYTLADTDLPKVLETTALAGVAVAFPLLADEVVDFSLGLPQDYKLKGLKLRWFFKEALKDFLPHDIIVKKKQGFGLPFGVWTCQHGGLQELAVESLRCLANRGLVRTDFVEGLLTIHLPAHPGYYGELVWILMMLEQWLRHFRPDYRLS